MARRADYTKVERRNFATPDHVEGMGDRGFKGFQCLNKSCTNFIFVLETDIGDDFDIECDKCGFHHVAGETTTLYDYDLVNKENRSIIQSGSFEILHNDYIGEAQQFKYCIVCGSLKPFELFSKHSPRKTKRQGECKLCKDVYNSLKNQTRLVEQHREASQKRRLYTQFDAGKFDIREIYRRFENKCFKCDADLSNDLSDDAAKKEGNLDHTLPVYYLWPMTTDNATLLCRAHNGEKAEKWPRSFYSDGELRRLSRLTGIEYQVLSGSPTYNPAALTKLEDPDFIEALFEKFARYPDELLRLRNRVLEATGRDFLHTSARISAAWVVKADNLRGRPETSKA